MEFLLFAAVLLLSIVVHEVAHAWQARREGDPTAEKLGRITLNPIPHLDLMGSIVVPALLWASNAGFLFGWAKPVPVVPSNYRDPRWGDIRVSLAGIVSNLVLAAGFVLVRAVFVGPAAALPGSEVFGVLAHYGLLINLILAFFNLVPIPPLDGSHVLYHFLPPAAARRYRAAGRYGLLVVMGLLFFVPGAFDVLLLPVDVVMGWADAFVRLWI